MKTIKVEIDGKEYEITELLATDVDDIDFSNKKESIKKQVMLSTNMTEDEFKKLTFNQRITLMKEINRLNGLTQDFQQPAGIF